MSTYRPAWLVAVSHSRPRRWFWRRRLWRAAMRLMPARTRAREERPGFRQPYAADVREGAPSVCELYTYRGRRYFGVDNFDGEA